MRRFYDRASTHIRFAFDAQTSDIRLFFEEAIFIGEQLTERDLLFTHLQENINFGSLYWPLTRNVICV